MDEIIVRVARTVACLPRLRILSYLARCHETTPTDLAKELDIPLDMVCTHLSRLSTAGLVERRRSAAWCYCSAGSPYSHTTLSGKLAAWLYAILRDPVSGINDFGPGQVRNCSSAEIETRLHELIFEAITAFTDLRRLQILRRLARKGPAAAQDLTRELSMSQPAVSRHTAKLIRRGYVKASRVGRLIVYSLPATFKTPAHAKLFRIIRAQWEKK